MKTTTVIPENLPIREGWGPWENTTPMLVPPVYQTYAQTLPVGIAHDTEIGGFRVLYSDGVYADEPAFDTAEAAYRRAEELSKLG